MDFGLYLAAQGILIKYKLAAFDLVLVVERHRLRVYEDVEVAVFDKCIGKKDLFLSDKFDSDFHLLVINHKILHLYPSKFLLEKGE